jgi:hypothetical protein
MLQLASGMNIEVSRMKPPPLFLAGFTIALVFASVGCAKQQQSARVKPPTPPVRAATASQPAPLQTELAALQESGALLEKLISDPVNTVPDAILNRTACFAVFRNLAPGTASAQGFAACRNTNGGWTSPVAANLSRPSETKLQGDLLLFIVSESARKQLLGGRVDLGRVEIARGLTNREAPSVADVELRKDALAYLHDGSGLHGLRLPKGVLSIDNAQTATLYGRKIQPAALLDKSTFSSSRTSSFDIDVGSFFNAINPVGIIVHHSVLVPVGTLPEAERALDRFHYKRGFEISCFGKVYHIAYHYLILPDGQIQAGRPERCEGAHARGYNSYLGIALVGDFSSVDNPDGKKGPIRPTAQQIATLVRLCRQLREKYNIPLQHIMPHSDVSRTACPGDRLEFHKLMAALEQQPTSGQ